MITPRMGNRLFNALSPYPARLFDPPHVARAGEQAAREAYGVADVAALAAESKGD